MRFLIDAQLPKRMIAWLVGAGGDAKHTLELPTGNRSTDQQVIEAADREQRVVVTKDADFVNSHLLSGQPGKLLLVSTGNISNQDLEQLVTPLLPGLGRDFQTHSFIELTRAGVIVRG
jgi:predicted nuclease of predicted toxin-antitoxin system